MNAFQVSRTGWNSANQSSCSCPKTVVVATVQAETPEEAVKLVGQHCTVYNNQYLSARPCDEISSEQDALVAKVEKFFEPREGKVLKTQFYRPNGGQATWSKLTWLPDEPEEEGDYGVWESAEVHPDGDEMTLFRHDGPVLHYESFLWCDLDD